MLVTAHAITTKNNFVVFILFEACITS
jgi:hypothetical protein